MNVSEITRESINICVKKTLEIHRKTNPLTGVQWADQYFYLSEESSLIKGEWQTLPWQVAILNAMTNEDIRGVYVQKSKRTGYTKMVLATIAYYVEHKIRKIGLWQPTDGDAKEFSLVELDPMIRDVTVVRNKFPYYGKKSSRNTVAYKQFTGSPVYIKGGKSAKNYRRMTLDVAILDEISAFDPDIEGEGSARKLAEGRTEGSPFRKLIAGSTPKIKGECQIEEAVKEADIELQYHWSCPHCHHEQVLEFGGRDTPFGFKWSDGDPQTVKYLCAGEHCGVLIDEDEFREQLEYDLCKYKDKETGIWTQNGEHFYNAENQPIRTPRYVAFSKVWAGYSPLVRWWEIVDEWLKSCKDPIKTKTFINTVLALTYDIKSGDKADKTKLQDRLEDFNNLTIPERICYITAGVDQQPDRFEIQVIGWGIGAEAWVLQYIVLPCDTSMQSSWENTLDPSLDRLYDHPNGRKVPISFAAIDTGGHATQEAYKYCVANEHKGRIAIKGKEGDRPIIPLKPSTNWSYKGKGQLKGWLVGTDTAKTSLYKRLENEQPGEAYIHFPKQGLPEDYFDQLTAEVRLFKINKYGRRAYYWWCPPGKRNEALDTFVYAIAALEHSGVDLALMYQKFNQVQQTLSIAELSKKLNGA